jgi:Uncharacterised nucleotidyltransferase
VSASTLAPESTGRFAALLAGEATPWTAFQMTPGAFLRACEDEGLTGLVHQRLITHRDDGWPTEVRETLTRAARARTATELLFQRQLITVLDDLAAENIYPVVLKGTALAHSLYESPAARPRADTDLLIRWNQVDRVRRVLGRNGYAAPTQCDGELLFCQFSLKKTDEFGLIHALDVHWKISTQSVFADVLRFDEIAALATPLPALGGQARMAGPVHALILACIHPVMHHRNAESLIWTYDIHLLASRLSDREFAAFVELAVAQQVSAICAHQLARARRWLGTRVPDAAMARLAAGGDHEPSAAYLQPGRHWGDEMLANLRGLPRWSDRLRLLREVTLPGPTYMLQAYGVASSSLGSALLPFLYCHRLVLGCWKVLAGRK